MRKLIGFKRGLRHGLRGRHGLRNDSRHGLRRQQRGDTIVEVMIVLAVLGLAIGIAYSTANRSLLNARQAQENSQATAIAQAQVEQIISIGCTSGNPQCDPDDSANPGHGLVHPTGGGAVCIVNGAVKPYTDSACAGLTSLPGGKVCIVSKDIGDDSGDCQRQPTLPSNTYEVVISWDDVLGQGRDTVTQDYSLPQ